ncbi:MAG: DUF3944 domain-containing protein [Bacteroides sp.]
MISMTPDKNLSFLQYAENNDLRTLCDILTLNNKGEFRVNEKLSDTDSYIECYPDNMAGMWKDIAYELQSFGGNTFMNVFSRHGRGPEYESIVNDVCRKVGVKVPRHAECEQMESLLLEFFCKKALDRMSEEELRSLCEELGITAKNKVTRTAMIAAIIATRKVSTRAYVFVLQTIMSFLERFILGRMTIVLTGGLLSRSLSILTGPVGMALLTGYTLWDLAGPAYRVTIPAVLQVAMMRAAYKSNLNKEVA